MADNIKVAIKVRPLVEREKDESLQWNVTGNTITPMDSKRRAEGGFQFDHIFGMQKKNEVIFATVVKPIIESAVNGFNGTVFAYGQTGSGKTFTMMGTDNEPGIIPLAVGHIFEIIQHAIGREFLIRFSYFEIYNEKINDLLECENSDLKIKEENGRIFVNKCSEKVTNGAKHMLTAMKLGEKNRSFGETNMNERSSRSHTIFRITIESREVSSDSDGAIKIAQLNLVDLAGSERASQTGATGDRFKEGKHINLSLSTLGLVIKQLSEIQDKDKPNFVNFRDSKLTRILQASLGGNSRTAIICTVTPASFEETYGTLLFACRAKSIQNKPQLNEDLSDEALLKRYKKQIVDLSKELERANQKIKDNQTIKDNQSTGLADRVALLKEYILSANKKETVRRRSCPVKFGDTNNFHLQPIIEDPGSETPKQAKIDRIKRRQSIIQSAALETDKSKALADFEISLLQSDIDRNDDFFISTRRILKPRVKFNGIDDVHIFNDTGGSDISPDKTPKKRCNCTISTSPGTPKSVLRERLQTVLEEHEQLKEFTILEKQLSHEEGQSVNVDDDRKTLRSLQKSLEDTYILYSDVNKKFSDLQTEHSLVVDECGSLRKQVESLSTVQERLGKIEIENKELHNKLNVALKAQQFAENENVSLSFQMESMQNKFKSREKELESSLQFAWKDNNPTRVEQTAKEILQLQNLVKTLNAEIEQLKSEKPLIQESAPIIAEIESLKHKLEETNRLLKESDFEKSSLIERLDSVSQRLLMKCKIEEYDNLLRNFEEDKILSLQRFDELAKELEEKETDFEISTLQKAVENLSSHLTELEQENVHVRRKFSVFLACIEFSCQQNFDCKLADDAAFDLSLNFEHWRKNVSYDEKEKSNIISELQKFRESVIRRSKSSESKLIGENEKETATKEDKETLTDQVEENLSSVKEQLNAEIAELNRKLEEVNVEKLKLEEELKQVKTTLLESGEKYKDYENLVLKLQTNETELNTLLEKVKTENSDVKSKLEEALENANIYQNEMNKMNSRIIDFDIEKLELNTNLSDALEKLKNYENIAEKMQDVQELNNRVKELDLENSRLKSQISEIEEKLTKMNEIESTLSTKEVEICDLKQKLKELEDINQDLRLKITEAEDKLNIFETLQNDNRLADDFELKLTEKETELNQFKLKFEEVNLENTEIKFNLSELEKKLVDYESLVQKSKDDNCSIEELKVKITEKEEKITELGQRWQNLEQLNSDLKLELSKAVESVENYVKVIESLKSETCLEINSLQSQLKELEDENSELKIQLDSVNLKENESSFCAIDSRVEEKEAEICQLSLRIKELGDENFELKSRVEETEEKLKKYEVEIESLNSAVERLSGNLQKKEIDLSHLNSRCQELKSINDSFAKSVVQSMNNTCEETFMDLQSGEDIVKSYLAENDAIKKRLEDFEKNVSIFQKDLDEQKTFVEGLEKTNLVTNETTFLQSPSKKMSTPRKMNMSINFDVSKSNCKSFNDENDFTSIFTNESYFEKMEIDETMTENETQNESQVSVQLTGENDKQRESKESEIIGEKERENEIHDFTAPSMMINLLKSNDVPILKRRIKDLETQNLQLDILYKELIGKLNDKGSEELANSVKEFKNLKVSLEIENARLRDDLREKIQESEEVTNGIQGLKKDIEKLEQTIYLLTSENLELMCKLNTEKEKNKENVADSQLPVNDIKLQVSEIKKEAVLENVISPPKQNLPIIENSTSIDELRAEILEGQKSIDVLKMENRKLTEELMYKIKELDSVKECKALQYDHECSYKDKNEALTKEMNTMQDEITDLSDDLMKHIDEAETFKQELEVALKKLQVYEQAPKPQKSPVQVILQEKKHLEAEVIELKSKVTKLSNENAEVTLNLSMIFDELEESPGTEICKNPLPTLESQSRRISSSWKIDQNVQALNNKIKNLEEQIEHLTILNAKLSDLKLSTCTQCSHLKELNENKRALKLEIKCLNNKLKDLQIKFEEKCANAEALRLKANEELNTSIILNGSTTEGMNITLMEENIRVLSNEKETLREEYEKLSILYHDKCSDLENLHDNQPIVASSPSRSVSSSKHERISKLESAIQGIGQDLHQNREKLAVLSSKLHKYKELDDKLKTSQETSATAEEKVKLLESEVATLYKTIEELKQADKILQGEKLNLDVEVQILQGENRNIKKQVEDLQNVLEAFNHEKDENVKVEDLQKIVEILNGEKKSLISELELAREEKTQLIELGTNLTKALKENQDLSNEITRLQMLVQKLEENKETRGEENKEKEELEAAKKLIIKETMSLTRFQDTENKSLSEIFEIFLKTLMTKEQEIMKTLKDHLDQEKKILVEAREQSEDAVKNANSWAKTLENEVEKVQSDLTLLEAKNTELKKQKDKLEQALEDTEHENQDLREKVQVLKTDCSNLQIELEKHSKNDKNKDLSVIQERERIQASIKNKEMELQSKMKQEKEEYNKKINELTSAVKNLETENLDLRNNFEGLEANEKQMKNIIDMKASEIERNNQLVKELKSEIENFAEVNNNLTEESLEKNRRIEEITLLLKNKCDVLSEYKTKLETLMPEYNQLKTQLEDRKVIIQKLKEDNESLKVEGMREINMLRDKLEEEGIKSGGLMKQLDELNKRNVDNVHELEGARNKIMEMEAANEKLVRKVRNSTSKSRVEKEMEDLLDKNRNLEKNLEGASNRISELLEAKTKAMTDLVDLKVQVETVKRENDDLRRSVDSVKTRHQDFFELRAKYEELLQEKNKIKLELEEKKLALIQSSKKIEELLEKLSEEQEKNSELDKEAEDLAQKIRENEEDIGKLEDENHDLKEKMTKEFEELRGNLKSSLQTNMDLRSQIEIIKRTEMAVVQKENEELRSRVVEMESKLESRSTESSRSTSPMHELDKRKQRRSILFNQKRNLDEVSDSGVSSSSTDCQCSELRKTVAEIGKEIAMKNGIIATLNVQIQSENFPYEKKCKDLQDELNLHKNKIRQLREEIYRLKKTMMDTSSQECEVCKRWRLNQRHQETQCKLEEKIYLSGTSSGIVSEYNQIKKLEKEKSLMKQLCRSRLAQIKQLEMKLLQATGQPYQASEM